MTLITLSSVIWDLASLNFWHFVHVHHSKKISAYIRLKFKMIFLFWSTEVTAVTPLMVFNHYILKKKKKNSVNSDRHLCACVGVRVCAWPLMCACHSDRKVAELCSGLHLLSRQIPQLNVLRRGRHWDTQLSLWVWIKHVTGVCVWVCVHAPWSLEECPRSTRSSGTPSKPESEYQPGRALILGGCSRADTYFTFAPLCPFNSSIIELSGKEITRCKLSVCRIT